MSDSLPLPAIDVDGVGKTYHLWERPSSRILVPLAIRASRLLSRLSRPAGARMESAARARLHEHPALADIHLRLMPGESLGIIGLNGSGKSTLLQIIAGVMAPTVGTVRTRGRVAALLELGSGFNPELTGRENIKINAAILGLSEAEILARLPEIIRFADIGDYVDEPVKTYSSGMALRLAFAVQVHVDPDVLIVDEALAVGDAQFQAKAMARIDEILRRGTTLLFVGHDLGAVKAFCKRAMLLEKGRIVMDGLPDDIVTEYLYRTHKRELESRGAQARIEPVRDGYAVAGAQVVDASINGGNHVAVGFGAALTIEFTVHLDASIAHPVLIFDVVDNRALQLSGRRIALPAADSARRLRVRVQVAADLQKGVYGVRTRLADAPSMEMTRVVARQEGTLSFEVIDDSRDRFTGLFALPMQVDIGEA